MQHGDAEHDAVQRRTRRSCGASTNAKQDADRQPSADRRGDDADDQRRRESFRLAARCGILSIGGGRDDRHAHEKTEHRGVFAREARARDRR